MSIVIGSLLADSAKADANCIPPPAGLTSWYQGEGNAQDSQGTNNGVLHGVTFAAGEDGQAFAFNGSSAYISGSASPSLNIGVSNGITIECWINPTDATSEHAIVEWDNTLSALGAQFSLSNPTYGGNNSFFANLNDVNGGSHIIYSPFGIITTNVFQHIAVTYDKTTGNAVLYLNGQAVASSQLGSFTVQTSLPLFIGSRAGVMNFFPGSIDELSFYNQALSASQIQAIYSSGVAGKCFQLTPPSITSQPQNQSVIVGTVATFSVTASGLRLGYQWLFGGVVISGATNASLSLSHIQPSDAGNYSVIVSNASYSVTSSNAVLSVTVPQCDPPAAGLATWFRAEGDAQDFQSGNTGVLHNITFAAGEVEQAFVFNGSSSYISVASSPTLNIGLSNGMTIECWVNPTDATSEHAIAEWDSSSANLGAQFSISNPNLGGSNSFFANLNDIGGNSHIIYSPKGIIVNNSFQHIAVTYSEVTGYAMLYLNGQPVATNYLGSFGPQTGLPLYIGSRAGVQNFFPGSIDELSFYGQQLSAAQIQAIYLSGSTGKCTPAQTPPGITSQPQGQTILVNGNVTFTVTAMGPNLNYQWRLNTTNISGATNASLILASVQGNQAGDYSVVISNLAASVTSSNAHLTVDTNCHSFAPGLVAWWAAEENASDYIGGNNGTTSNITYSSGEAGQAFDFDGSSSFVLAPASASLNVGTNAGLTIECWINPTNATAEHGIVEWDSSESGSLGAQFSLSNPTYGGTNSFFANLKDTGGASHIIYAATGIVTNHMFQHIAVTYDTNSGIATLYFNGQVAATQNLGRFIPQTSYALYIGSRVGTSNFFPGKIDELSIYQRALSGGEINTIFNNGAATKGCFAPQIVSQPTNLMVSPSNTVSVLASLAGSLPISYQWFGPSGAIAGTTNNLLNYPPTQFASGSSFYLVASNSLGSATSSNFTVSYSLVQVTANNQVLSNAQNQLIGVVTVQLKNYYTNGYIFFTLDGSTPTFSSTAYTAPLVLSNSVTIRALGYSSDFTQSTVTGPIGLTIIPAYTLSATSPGGGKVTVSPLQTTYVAGTNISVMAVPSNGWTFLQWQGDLNGSNATNSITLTRNKSIQAIFGTTLTSNAVGNGSINFNPPGGLYPYNTALQVSAIPQPGNQFALWGNAANGSTNPLPYVVKTTNANISALFSTLSAGQVSLAVVPIDHGRVTISPQSNSYPTGTTVTLTATADTNQSFSGWSGATNSTQNPLVFVLNQSAILYAHFSTNNTFKIQPIAGTGEGVALTINGEISVHYRIDGSTDFTNWVTLLNVTNAVGQIYLIDTNAVSFTNRFYRAVILQ